ncbi:pyridoxal phosphate-dependent aminotransferase [Aquipuribacter hungaricus]|uniref:Pyridoxal phosphate-dependent aminotransferase n=1 Tax=Aquipuribacter hungaricus TaxID=545624 RepID=A0ABV7WIB4_9MICO
MTTTGTTGTAAPDAGPLVRRMRGFGTTIFAEMSALATATGAVNLGQGFPDFDGPAVMLEAARQAISDGLNQYPPGPGTPQLREAVAAHQQRWYGIAYDPVTEVVVTAGATEAVTAAVLALCEAGDEVVVLDPLYDSYAASVALAGAVVRAVPLRPDEGGRFVWDEAELRAAFGPRTRMLLLNSPHNPTGTVLGREELALLAALCVEHDVWAVCDEVYEHLVLDGEHLPLATFPGMAGRTLQVGSAGKTFSCTGWKVGWVCGPAPLVAAVLRVKQYLTFTGGSPFQPAVALALGLEDAFFDGFAADMRGKRDRLSAGLAVAGFGVGTSQGTYFLVADVTPVVPAVLGEGAEVDGLAFCRALPERCGVVAVPVQVFYATPGEGRHLVRFTFGKRDEVLDEGVRRLAALRG